MRKLSDFMGEDFVPFFPFYVILPFDRFPHKIDDFAAIAGFNGIEDAKRFIENHPLFSSALEVWEGTKD